MSGLEKPVSICIRYYNDAFDYPGCERNHWNIPVSYYQKAIEMMGEDRKYIICSNDVDRYKKVFKGDNFFFNDMKTKSEKHSLTCVLSLSVMTLLSLIAHSLGGVHG